MTSSFEDTNAAWLADRLSDSIPANECAYSFNLFEPAGEPGVKFGVELIGAASFDEADPDWACGEAWEPANRRMSIPENYSGDNWETCLKRMKSLVERLLSLEPPYAQKLKHSKGVGIGFVDGDLELIWKA